MIKQNVGNVDRNIRIILGLLFIILGIFVLKTYQIILNIVGIIILLTGIFRFCGLYILFGINTCKKNNSQK